MVMSRQNLKGKLFNNIYKKWQKESEPVLEITDAFNKVVDSVKIKLNEFGSMSGSFKIPKTAATGDWNIDPDYIETARNSGMFKVEEYKRPSYEITIDKPIKELKPKDSFSFIVKVRSFSGAVLNNVKINYSVNRSGEIPFYDSLIQKDTTAYKYETLADTSAYTNADGILRITVNDTLLQKFYLQKDGEWNFRYTLFTEAVDAGGESYEAEAAINVASKHLNINIAGTEKLKLTEVKPLQVKITDKNYGKVDKQTLIQLYKVTKPIKFFSTRELLPADVWLYEKNDLQKTFPLTDILKEQKNDIKELLFSEEVNSATQKIELDRLIKSPGDYEIEATVTEDDVIAGQVTKKITVFEPGGGKTAYGHFHYQPINQASPGDTLDYYYGSNENNIYSIFHTAYFENRKKNLPVSNYEEKINENGIFNYQIPIPKNAVSKLKITQLFILNNRLFSNDEDIFITETEKIEPEIIVEKYRKKLSPGSSETFTVSVKTKNENTAAELLTAMYDASLDKLEKHIWEKPYFNKNTRYISTGWPLSIHAFEENSYSRYSPAKQYRFDETDRILQPLWWLNPLDYAYAQIKGVNLRKDNYNFQHDMNPDIWYSYDPFDKDVNTYGMFNSLAGRVAGVTISNTQGLDEVVVIGYSTVSRKDLTGSVSSVRIRGVSSFAAYNQPLVIIDGVVYSGDLKGIDPKTITDGIVLKGADAAVMYGSRAAEGVLILSTKGQIILPKEPEPVIVPRKNFNETAFFFPEVHADNDGFYTFSFTMPESVTEWNWKMMAHTKKAAFAYAERKLYTQLPLMIQPNMPRLLYQGDKIILQSRITNLDSVTANGAVHCKIEDAVTNEDITDRFTSIKQGIYSVLAKQNTAAAFTLVVPQDQLNPVKIIITARSANFVDGEEHIIPIQSKKIFTRQNTDFSFVGTDTTIQLKQLPKDADFFGIGISINPASQAALINSLPGLVNYTYGCAEQTFNKILASTIAYKLMRTDTVVRKSYEKYKKSVENNTTALPDELSEESMPWLHLQAYAATQQKQLYQLLDSSLASEKLKTLLQKLYKMQNQDGGIAWFDGGESDFYISCYLMKGFAKLSSDGQLLPEYLFGANTVYPKFYSHLVSFCDRKATEMIKEKAQMDLLYYSYARTYNQYDYLLQDSLRLFIEMKLIQKWETIKTLSLYQQALLIISSLNFAANKTNILYLNALKQLESILQMAIIDNNGVRWKDLADNDDLTNSAEETISLLAEAYKLTESSNKTVNGILQWLLTTKTEHGWSNTKATAAAINLLMQNNTASEVHPQAIQVNGGNTVLNVNNDLLNGNTFAFSNLPTFSTAVKLKKENKGTATGSLHSYYFTDAENTNQVKQVVTLKKQWYRWNDNKWELITENSILNVADKIKVIETINTPKPLRYVFINDSRAAVFEPTNNSSGYEYQEGIGYYRSVRDAGFNFFFDFIPSGEHKLEYELKVAHEGVFYNNVSVLQCMYKPAITSYSNTLKIKCGK